MDNQYGVTTTTNLSDARTLIRATRPRVVVMAAEFQAQVTAESSGSHAVARATRVVRLPAGFSTDDAGDAAQQLLDNVRGAIVD